MFAKVRIAGCEFTKSITDANDRSSVEHVIGHALVLHPTPVNNAVLVFPAKPVVAS
jgi:hypothetical protein